MINSLTSVEEGMDSGFKVIHQSAEFAKRLIAKALLPKVINRYEIERFYRKAHRLNAWRYLKFESRALLYVARKVVNVVRSPILSNALRNVFLEITLYTLKGRALLQAVIINLKRSKTLVLSAFSKERINELLAEGINYLNNPPIFRVYGSVEQL